MLLAGPFGSLVDDVREFLWCVADDDLPLTGRDELCPSGLRRAHERLPGGGPLGSDQVLPAIVRRRMALLRSLCDAGRLVEADGGHLRLSAQGWEFLGLPPGAQAGFVFAAWWEGVDWGRFSPRAGLGRLLYRKRDVLLQELAALPGGRVDLASFVGRFRVLVAHHWTAVAMLAGPEVWRCEMWATALAPLAVLGALEVPGAVTAEPPAWFAVSDSATDLLAAAAAMSGSDVVCAAAPSDLN